MITTYKNEITQDLLDEYDYISSTITERLIERFEYIDIDDVLDEYEEVIAEYGDEYIFPKEAPDMLIQDVIEEVNDYIREQLDGADNNNYLLRSYYQSVM